MTSMPLWQQRISGVGHVARAYFSVLSAFFAESQVVFGQTSSIRYNADIHIG